MRFTNSWLGQKYCLNWVKFYATYFFEILVHLLLIDVHISTKCAFMIQIHDKFPNWFQCFIENKYFEMFRIFTDIRTEYLEKTRSNAYSFRIKATIHHDRNSEHFISNSCNIKSWLINVFNKGVWIIRFGPFSLSINLKLLNLKLSTRKK